MSDADTGDNNLYYMTVLFGRLLKLKSPNIK